MEGIGACNEKGISYLLFLDCWLSLCCVVGRRERKRGKEERSSKIYVEALKKSVGSWWRTARSQDFQVRIGRVPLYMCTDQQAAIWCGCERGLKGEHQEARSHEMFQACYLLITRLIFLSVSTISLNHNGTFPAPRGEIPLSSPTSAKHRSRLNGVSGSGAGTKMYTNEP